MRASKRAYAVGSQHGPRFEEGGATNPAKGKSKCKKIQGNKTQTEGAGRPIGHPGHPDKRTDQ